ncbi:phage portal protein [uncultured Amphritea sp.]|uniref:phage portal protein n=1 Tax=uncultured Amphritea sp. TaxID=981605 RepID=UPI0025CDECCC|nr:phage portal protein [uncultured Amphritea sp.]
MKTDEKAVMDETRPSSANGKPMAFTFGDPESVLDNSLTDYLGTFLDDIQDFYVPPVSQRGLIQTMSANAHHGSCIYFKRNLLVQRYIPSPLLSLMDLYKAALDFEATGNAYLQIFTNAFGQQLRLGHLPGVNMRYGNHPYGGKAYCMLKRNGDKIWFDPGEVIHIKEYDPLQTIYGLPQFMGGLQAALLGEDATLFRRRYFKNGSHMGYIFYTNDPNMPEEVESKIINDIRAGKGVGNFKSMFINIPNGGEKAVQIIPIGDISQKDEFERIKRISADEVLVAHRMQPSLAGVKPENTAGFGDIQKISDVYIRNEIGPKAMVFMHSVNEHLKNGKKINFDIPD